MKTMLRLLKDIPLYLALHSNDKIIAFHRLKIPIWNLICLLCNIISTSMKSKQSNFLKKTNKNRKVFLLMAGLSIRKMLQEDIKKLVASAMWQVLQMTFFTKFIQNSNLSTLQRNFEIFSISMKKSVKIFSKSCWKW